MTPEGERLIACVKNEPRCQHIQRDRSLTCPYCIAYLIVIEAAAREFMVAMRMYRAAPTGTGNAGDRSSRGEHAPGGVGRTGAT